MKVLFNAREQEWKKVLVCTHCTSKLEIEAKDLEFHSDQRDGDSYQFWCVVCGGTCWIDATLVPRGLVHP